MVSDIGEFSIRGDIADIYTLEESPVRIEFWGDEIVDIRFFDNETQKSIEKIKQVNIKPLYKFILPEKAPANLPKELKEPFENEGYFEGVNVYQSYFNDNLESILATILYCLTSMQKSAQNTVKLTRILLTATMRH